MTFRHKSKKTSLQFTIPENLDNNDDHKRDIHGSNQLGSRKRQELLSKLGAWGPWERVEGEGRRKGGETEKNI